MTTIEVRACWDLLRAIQPLFNSADLPTVEQADHGQYGQFSQHGPQRKSLEQLKNDITRIRADLITLSVLLKQHQADVNQLTTRLAGRLLKAAYPALELFEGFVHREVLSNGGASLLFGESAARRVTQVQ